MVVNVSEDTAVSALKKISALDLFVKRLSEGKRTFARGKVLMLEAERFCASGSFRVYTCNKTAALKKHLCSGFFRLRAIKRE